MFKRPARTRAHEECGWRPQEDHRRRECSIIRAELLKAYPGILDFPLPKAFNEAVCSDLAKRQRGETLVAYSARNAALFTALEKAGVKLPSNARGYMLLRDSKLTDDGLDTMARWTKNEFELDVVLTEMLRLERPEGISETAGFTAYLKEDEPTLPAADADAPATTNFWISSDGRAAVLHVTLDELLHYISEDQLRQDFLDDDVAYASSDALADGMELHEDDIIAILANYRDVRRRMHDTELSRGFWRPGAAGTTNRGGLPQYQRRPQANDRFANMPSNRRVVRTSRRRLEGTSIFARCGKKGHFARSCVNPPDARGAKAIEDRKKAGMPPFGSFFIGLLLAASIINNAEAVHSLLHQMEPTDGLLDTGAEHGVIGKPQRVILQEQLSTYNL